MAHGVEHPEHYKAENLECIEVMRKVYGDVAVYHFCICNAFKYVWRCEKKDSFSQDAEKAAYYLGYAEIIKESLGG